MTPTQKRLRELVKRQRRGNGLSDKEECELDNLFELRKDETVALLPRPNCCEQMRLTPAFQLIVDIDKTIKGAYWHLTPPKVFEEARWRKRDLTADPMEYLRPRSPKFCPFCAKTLPRPVLKTPFPPDTCIYTDGGYYCDTCHERLDGCQCNPLSSAFELVSDP